MRFSSLFRSFISAPVKIAQICRSASLQVQPFGKERYVLICILTQFFLESSLTYADSVLILSLVLPSRQETCRFHLNLQQATVGQLIDEIHGEDPGVQQVQVFDQQGNTLAKSYTIESLLKSPFTIQLNQQRTFLFDPIKKLQIKESSIIRSAKADGPSTEDTVAALYQALNSMKVYHSHYTKLKQEANELSTQLEPLEKVSDF